MAYRQWQIGLDIQNGQLYALATQYHRRYGWQLRYWWQQQLPPDTLINGVLQSSEHLIGKLRALRRRLPRSISLRVGIHPQLALHHQLTIPKSLATLREPERDKYIIASAERLFPLNINELMLDYREDTNKSVVHLTVARKVALNSWLTCLDAAGFSPDILEQTPAALCSLALALNLSRDATLIHGLNDHWLWYAPSLPDVTGWCQRSEVADITMLINSYLPVTGQLYLSDVADNSINPLVSPLLPFSAFRVQAPPLPVNQQGFALATGLALRPEDKAWSG